MDLEAELKDLARRVRVLEDIEAIKRLKARYCLHVDSGEPDKVADLFTADAVWDGGAVGRYEGRDAIRAFMRDLPKMLSFALHHVMNPLIEVDGDAATGHWYLIEPCTMARTNQAVWGTAMYQDRYVRRDGDWRFADVKLVPVFWTPFDQGWAKQKSVLG